MCNVIYWLTSHTFGCQAEGMEHIPWIIVGIVFVLTTALVAARIGLSGPSITLAAISSIATIFGAFCAPTTFTTPRPSPAEWRSRKEIQLVAAGFVTALLVWIFDTAAGVAAIGGIVAALMVGAVWPRKSPTSGQADA